MNIPKDKYDVAAVESLKALPIEEIYPHIPELLEWLKDSNWPISNSIAELLSGCGTELVDPVRKILKGDDAIWEKWIISELLCHTTPDVRIALSDDIYRIINDPTDDEIAEGVLEAARTLS